MSAEGQGAEGHLKLIIFIVIVSVSSQSPAYADSETYTNCNDICKPGLLSDLERAPKESFLLGIQVLVVQVPQKDKRSKHCGLIKK